MTEVDRRGVEVMYRDECLKLLAEEEVGRIGIVDGTHPLVLPVNFGLDGSDVVFRTAAGAKLDAARGRSACFEVDSFDRTTRSGWSVIVQGRLEEVTHLDAALLDRIGDLAHPWLPEGRDHVVRLASTSITGRRVRPAPTTS